ncbi:MAG TPA: hypothetical protein VMB48_01865 [Steroidobacteraceae bacterium]|nr:hypothetical protein [Steroidobacteraceae bacterium]
MTRPRTRASARERSRAVIGGGGVELPAEGAREDLVAAEADVLGNHSHLPAARQKLGRGTLEPQAQRVLPGCLAEELAQGPMEVECGPSGTAGQALEAPRSEHQMLNDAQKLVPTHRQIIDPGACGA